MAEHNVLLRLAWPLSSVPSVLAAAASPFSSSLLFSYNAREMKSSGGTEKLERKTVEKNRRIHMKNLRSKLCSLIPMSKNAMTQQDQLDQAFYYIKELKERVDRLRELKEMRSRVMIGFRPSHVEVRNLDPNLEVILVRGSRTRFMFHEVISVLEEEGVEVISASFSTVGDRIFHSIHCQAISTRIGLDPSRVDQRLKELVRR